MLKKLLVFCANVVASSQHLAATAGLRMMAKGGNAVDAAIASAIAITVVEPTMNGIGADAFCILWDGSKLVGLNASGHSPALMTPTSTRARTRCRAPAGAASACRARCRCGSAAQALWQAALRRPVRAGDQVRQRTASASPTWWRGSGRAPSTGCSGQQDWVPTLCRAAARPSRARCGSFPIRPGRSPRSPRPSGEAFYRGELAEAIDSHARATGGAFAATTSPRTRRLGRSDRPHLSRHALHEIPPSGQGIAA